MSADQQQLGFDSLLSASDADNEKRRQGRECAHLPGSMEEALPFYRALIEKHHAAMLAGDADAAQRIRSEAHDLALKLNNYEPGIIADDDAPGCVLARETRAADGVVPLWGQEGSFIVTRGAMRVRIELEGLFGIGSSFMAWPGFSAHAVDWDKPFLSETGYRSFLGVGGALKPGHTPETFCAAIIDAHVTRALKGKLRMIEPRYRRGSSAYRGRQIWVRPGRRSCDALADPASSDSASTAGLDPVNVRPAPFGRLSPPSRVVHDRIEGEALAVVSRASAGLASP